MNRLGISVNKDGLKAPRCGKQKMKRGRKTLIELRSATRQAKNQKNISDILNAGKGKFLPNEQ